MANVRRLPLNDGLQAFAVEPGGDFAAEEVADGGSSAQVVTEQTVDATPTGTRKMSRRSKSDAGTSAPEPPTAAVEDYHSVENSTEDPASPDGITDAQSRKMHAAFNDLGITDREQRLGYCTNLIGRQIETSKELTRDEASRVIDALEADLSEPGEPEDQA